MGLDLTAAVGDDSAVPELSRMVLDTQQPNRLEALRVLTLFYTPRLRPVFQDVVASSRETRLRKAALEAFWRNHDLEAVDYLVGVAEDDEDEEVRIAAGIHTVGGLSAHGDQQDLLRWYQGFDNQPPVWLVHGEPAASGAFAERCRELGIAARIAKRGEWLDLARLSASG